MLGHFVHIEDFVACERDVGIHIIGEILSDLIAPAERNFVTVVVYLTNVQVRQCSCDDAWGRFRRDQNACAVFDKVVEGSGQAAVEELKINTVVLLVGCFPGYCWVTHT